MIPTHTIDCLGSVFDSMTALAETFTEAQWKTPTLLPGWSVQDNYSHLIGIERMLQGLPGTTHRSPEVDHVKNAIGAANENEVDARRSMTGAEVLAEWKELTALRMSTLRGADEGYFAREMMNPTGPGTLADFLHVRVLDCWMHEQDVRRVLDLPGHGSGPAAELTIDRLIRTIPIVVGKRAGTPEGDTVVVELTGPVTRHIPTTVVEGRAKVGVEGRIVATISMDSDTFVQLAGGRVSHADVADHVTLGGDVELGRRVVGQFNMMI